ncbi:MAG: hypothetical protein ACRESE_08855, partial [Gammaproteobacteria bacterium]
PTMTARITNWIGTSSLNQRFSMTRDFPQVRIPGANAATGFYAGGDSPRHNAPPCPRGQNSRRCPCSSNTFASPNAIEYRQEFSSEKIHWMVMFGGYEQKID